MKSTILGILLAAALSVPAAAKPVHANVVRGDDTEFATYIVSADEKNLMCSPDPSGRSPEAVPRSDVKQIIWREPEDWTAAWELYTQHQYLKAAEAMAAVHENYKGIIDIEDSFGCLAKFYQCESLRLSGKYPDLMEQFEIVRDYKLSDKFKAQVSLFNCWGHLGKEYWPALKNIMDDYQIDVATIPDHTIPPTGAPFKPGLQPREIIQVAYLRGLSEHMLMLKKREDLKKLIAEDDERNLKEIARLRVEVSTATTIALNDYGRTLTVSYGDEKLITKNAMLRFLELISEDPNFKENYVMQKEAHAVAHLYKDLHGGGKVPPDFIPFLTEPKPPEEETSE